MDGGIPYAGHCSSSAAKNQMEKRHQTSDGDSSTSLVVAPSLVRLTVRMNLFKDDHNPEVASAKTDPVGLGN